MITSELILAWIARGNLSLNIACQEEIYFKFPLKNVDKLIKRDVSHHIWRYNVEISELYAYFECCILCGGNSPFHRSTCTLLTSSYCEPQVVIHIVPWCQEIRAV